jgi:hypothetical protein
VPCRGWCPRGRRAEDGPLDPRYPLTETSSSKYPQRTACNVRDSDGTLVLRGEDTSRGTDLTVKLAARYRKPCLVLNLEEGIDVAAARAWTETHQVRVLNVAGPRESECPGIYAHAARFVRELLTA